MDSILEVVRRFEGTLYTYHKYVELNCELINISCLTANYPETMYRIYIVNGNASMQVNGIAVDA